MSDSTKSVGGRMALLLATVVMVCACSVERWAGVQDRDPTWMKQSVAGSRIPRRLDSFGNPATGTQVQVISDQALQSMSGTSLADKLSGTRGGF